MAGEQTAQSIPLEQNILLLQDPDAGPAMVGNACTQVGSMSVPPQTIRWTCGIAVKGDYACGGGTPSAPSAPSAPGSIGLLHFMCFCIRAHILGRDCGHLCI